MQNTSTVEIFSGEKKVTVFVCSSGNGSKPLGSNTEESTLSSYFLAILISDTSVPVEI